MSALAEALVAAQRRALSAMEKRYAAGQLDADGFREIANGMGLTDTVDQDRLLVALETIRVYGAALPAEPTAPAEKPPEKATPGQQSYIRDLLRKGNYTMLAEQDLANMSAERAAKMITALRAGTYDPTEFDVPF